MAKSILTTLLPVAQKLLSKNSATSKQAAPKFAQSVASAVKAATAASTGNFEKIKFGPYDWLVLERKGDMALIITERSVRVSNWHEKMEDIQWEKCTLRAYLNGDFYNSFSTNEQSRIVEVTNETPSTRGVGCKIPGGNPTKDKVFLLSLDEVLRYFGDSTVAFKAWFDTYEAIHLKKIPVPKGFNSTGNFSDNNSQLRVALLPANAEGRSKKRKTVIVNAGIGKEKEKTDGDSPYPWWTRSRGRSKGDYCAAAVGNSGLIYDNGYTLKGVVNGNAAVRPALWLKM